MLTHYRKEQRKIAMGLLSFHKKMAEQHAFLTEIDTYEQAENFRLYLWKPVDSQNVQGVIGIQILDPEQVILHDVVISPSYRGEKLGYQLLEELAERYPEVTIKGTSATNAYLTKWKAYKE